MSVLEAAAVAQQPSTVEQPERTQPPSAAADETTENGNVSASSPAGDEVVEAFEERIDSLDTLVMTVETNLTVDGDSMRTERRTWIDYENDQVTRFDHSSDPVARTQIDRAIDRGELTYEGSERVDGELTH